MVFNRKAYDKQYYKDHAEKRIQYTKQYRKNHSAAVQVYGKQYAKDRKDSWLEFLQVDSLKCQECGYNEYFVALQFHHRDPKLKKFAISTFAATHTCTKKNQVTLLKEQAKCDVLCSNCHDVLHWKLKQEEA